MRGHINKRQHQKKDGSISTLYYAVVELPRVAGKRRADWGSGFARKKDAEAELNRKIAQLSEGTFIERSDRTVKDLGAEWIAAATNSIKPTTAASYRRSLYRYILPRIGHLPLREVTPAVLQELTTELLREGGRNAAGMPDGTPLAPKTVRNHLGVLDAAFSHGVTVGYIAANPMKAVRKPSGRRSKEMSVYDSREVSQLMIDVKRHRLSALFRLAFYTGARRGELLGLRWSDFDPDERRIAIRQNLVMVDGVLHFDTPKSHHARTVDIDRETVTKLMALKSEQEKCLDGRRPTGGLVFVSDDNSPLRPDSVSQWFDKAVRDSTLDRRISFHEIRHTHASLLLQARVPPHIVSRRLGHADVGFTLKTYAHMLPGEQADAADTFARLIRSADAERPDSVDEEPPDSANGLSAAS